MRTPYTRQRRDIQRGAALLVFLGMIILVAAGILLSRLNAAVAPTPNRDPGTTETLAKAKEALIAWAATHPDTPGLLPFPDRSDDSIPNYDGTSDCVPAGAIAPGHLLGRFPVRGEQTAAGAVTAPGATTLVDSAANFVLAGVSDGDLVRNVTDGSISPVAVGGVSTNTLTLLGLTGGGSNTFATGDRYVVHATDCMTGIGMSATADDSSGERLWYAVSQNLVRGGGGGLINPDLRELATQPWITVRDQTGAVISNQVAAVLIAPGPAIGTQDRGTIVAAAATEYPKYLDSVTIGADTFDNADYDACLDDDVGCATPGEDFIIFPNTAEAFNDRLVYITVDELMAAVENRALGVAAQALKTYRDNAGGGDVYPWLIPFSNPRVPPPPRIATNLVPSTTSLVDSGASFVTDGVMDGDIVLNLSTGAVATVATGGVTPTTLTLNGFDPSVPGATFSAGDSYDIHPPTTYQPTPDQLEGFLPVPYYRGAPNLVWTGFKIQWDFDNEGKSDGGVSALKPADDAPEDYWDIPVTFADGEGVCLRTPTSDVVCRGTTKLDDTPSADIRRTIEVFFSFPATTTNIIPATASNVTVRNHTHSHVDYETPAGLAPTTNPILFPAGQAWSVRVTQEDTTSSGTCPHLNTPYDCGWRTAEPVIGTELDIIQFDGIRDDVLSGPAELPAWFVDNNWHQFVHVAISGANAPGGSGTCAVPPAGTPATWCLEAQLNTAGTPASSGNDFAALVVGPGPVLPSQNRNTGATACPLPHPAFFCDYFEDPNRDVEVGRNHVFGRTLSDHVSVDNTFNDQIRTVPP